MKFFEKDWGFMAGNISKFKFEFLPRLTVINLTHALEINVGFLWFQLWLTIFDRQLQEFNKRENDTK